MIDAVGEYNLRNGAVALIDTVKESKFTFSIHGYVIRLFRGKMRPHGYEIWKPDGSYMAVGEHPLDIVSKR